MKEAVKQTKAVITENRGYRQTAPAAVQRGAKITGLRQEAASFATMQQNVKADEKSYAGEQASDLKRSIEQTMHGRRPTLCRHFRSS